MLDSMVGKLLTMREKMGGLMEGLLGGGEDEEEGIDSLREFSDRIEQFRAILRDPAKTDFRVVLVPEELSVRESERLLDRLEQFGVPVGTVVVNRVMQDPGEVADLGDDIVAPNHTDCEFCKRRWDVQRGALDRSQELFMNHDVRRVPLFAEEVQGEKLLRIVAACLEE